MTTDYAARRARMDRDPAFRSAVHARQTASRRKRREAQWEAHIQEFGRQRVCSHIYPGDRKCWKLDTHLHGGDRNRTLFAQEIIEERQSRGD